MLNAYMRSNHPVIRIFTAVTVLFVVASCALKPSARILTKEEKDRYQLNGIIHNARICPTTFDEKTNSSVVSGDCEILSCEQVNAETVCRAQPEK